MGVGMTKHQPPQRHEALHDAVAELIQRLAGRSDTVWSFGTHVRRDGGTHALDEMKADGIEFSDALYVLKRCVVERSEYIEKYKEMRFRAVGENVDGIKMTFIVTIGESNNDIEIVTAWKHR
jgi:uncharacterized DUF497 family protein